LITQQPGGPPVVDILNVLQGFQTRGGLVGRGAGGNATGARGPVIPNRPNAWWLNDDVTAQLGLTEDQKLRVERAFENRREEIVSSTALLEKEEAQLARLLEADPINKSAILGQVDRVIQARGEVERINSAMTMEMRESLTRAQWMQLQSM